MAIDRSKVQAQAQKFVLKGQVDKAIAEYKILLDDDPSDLKVCQKLGDLYSKKGDKKNAAEQYNRIAADYQEKGFYLKAIAVYKQIVRLEPDELSLYMKLGELYNKQGLPAEAVAQYRIVAGRHEKEGRVKDALEVIGKMADLDPSNIAMRVKLAENYIKEGLSDKAASEVLKAGQELGKQGKNDEKIKLLEKFANADSSNNSFHKELAAAYIEKGDKAKAINSLKQSLKISPDDLKVLNKIAELYRQTGDKEKEKLSLQHIIRINPSLLDARKALYDVYVSEGDTERAFSEYETLIDLHLKNEDFPSALEAAEFLHKENPENLKVMAKLCEIHRFMNEEDKLVSAYKELASLYSKKGDQPHCLEIAGKILELRPDDADALKMKGQDAAQNVQQAAPEEEEDAPLSNSQIGKLLTEVDVYLKYGMEDKARESLEGILRRNSNSIDARLKLKEYYIAIKDNKKAIEELMSVAGIARDLGEEKTAVEAIKEALKISPGYKPAEDLYKEITGEDADALLVEDIDVEIEIDADEEVLELEVLEELDEAGEDLPGEAVSEKVEQLSSADIDEKLEEIEFYLQQELFEKAGIALEKILEIEPDNKVALDKKSRLAELEKAAEKAAAPQDGGFFDLAGDLASELDSALGVDGGLMGFDSLIDSSKELMASDVADEDSQTHYDLGIAYKEMGVYDEAINEFKIAMKDQKKAFDAYNMAGLCYMEKGEPEEAMNYFRSALEMPDIPKGAEINLNYEMGIACRAAGDAEEAKVFISRVYSADKSFRDVEVIFAELGGFGGGDSGGGFDGMETVSEKDLEGSDKKNKDKISYI